jgi:hypothetical protein
VGRVFAVRRCAQEYGRDQEDANHNSHILLRGLAFNYGLSAICRLSVCNTAAAVARRSCPGRSAQR